MCGIHELFEFVGSTESRGNTEEIGAMIAERSIVRVLYNTHDLNNLVTQLLYLRKHMLSKMVEGMNLLLDACHANMTFIDGDSFVWPFGPLVFPLVIVERDVDAIEDMGSIVLPCKIYPCWDTVFIFT